MAADDVMSVIRRASSMVDTSGAYYKPNPPNLSVVPIISERGGVYQQNPGDVTGQDSVLPGRIALAVLGGIVVGVVGFNFWTSSIQGGG